MKKITYTFNPVKVCNMCGTSCDQFKVLGKRLNASQGFRPSKKTGISTSIVKCLKCNLIFSNPQPVPKSINDHYGIPSEDYWTEDYFHISENYFAGELKWLNSLMPFKKGMKYLDIGAGIGKQMIVLSNAGYDSFGLEPSKQFRDVAIKRNSIPENRIIHSTIEEASYPSDHFHFISFGAVLEHLYDPSESIKKALQWLKPGGLIHIEVPSADWLIHKILNFSYKIRGSDYVANLSPMHVPYHLFEFSLNSFKENGQINNYKIADYDYYVCRTYMPKILDPILSKYMKMTNTGMQLCVWLTK